MNRITVRNSRPESIVIEYESDCFLKTTGELVKYLEFEVEQLFILKSDFHPAILLFLNNLC